MSLNLSIIFHAIDGLVITIKNRKARKVNYAHNNPSANSVWASRNMGVLGTIILVYIVLHMGNFWVEYHWGELSKYRLAEDGTMVKDLYTFVVKSFSELWYVAIYVVAMIAISFHLYHGFKSAFDSLGLRHPKYTPAIRKFGYAFAIVIPALFAIIPVYVYLFY